MPVGARPPTSAVFEEALTLFQRRSVQCAETARQMQARRILPAARRAGLSVLDIGAGEGRLASLMNPLAGTLVLLEPNPRCVELLKERFPHVYPDRWDERARDRLRDDHPEGFGLVTMTHMLYHFSGPEEIRARLRLALTLLNPGGHLVITLNQETAPMARMGIRFQLEEGRLEESSANQGLHASCHDKRFYEALASDGLDVEIAPMDGSLRDIGSWEELIRLFRMPLLDPLSHAPCDTERLDAFIAADLDSRFPGLAYPATIPSRDDLIVLRKSPT